jgi:hypothetical protein
MRIRMIRMSVCVEREEHNIRSVFPDDTNDLVSVFDGVLNVAVRDSQVFAYSHAEGSGCRGSFLCADLAGAPRTEFTFGQFGNADGVTLLEEFDDGSAARKFNIVWVRTDGEYVKFHLSPSIVSGANIQI